MNGIFFEQFDSSYIPHILKEIYMDRIYDRFFKDKKDMVVLDIGANVGLFTHYAYPFSKKIYSVEPAAQHIKVIDKMLTFNKMADKVEVIQKAIFHKDEKMVFHHNQNQTMFSLNNAVADPSLPTENVEAVRMDTLFTQLGIDEVDFMKLDIEGAEMEVIGGEGFEMVKDKIKAMVVEYHAWSGRNPAQLVTTLQDYGFDVFPIPSDAKLFGAVRR